MAVGRSLSQWISVYFDPSRGGYHARWRTRSGDTKRKIPHEWLRNRSVDPSRPSSRGDRVAVIWATENAPTNPATGAMPLQEIDRLYRRMNPEQNLPITLEKTRQQAVHLCVYFDTQSGDLISRADATEYRDHRLEEGAKPRTVRNELATLKQLLDFALEFSDRTGVHALKLSRLPSVRREDRGTFAMTPAEFLAMLAVPLDRYEARSRAVMVWGVTTMLRRSVLFGLRHEWIDREDKWLTVPAEFMKGRSGSKRGLSIPLTDWALSMIGPGSGLVFPSHRGETAMTKIEGTLRRLSGAIGLTRDGNSKALTPHDLRRTGTSWLEAGGVNRLVRKILLGHRIDADVLELYTHREKKALREAVAVFDGILTTEASERL